MNRVVLCLTAMAVALSSQAGAVTLKIVVDGIESADGKVQLSLEDSKQSYYGEAQPLKVVSVDANAGQVAYEFRDLSPGTYSLKAFHDKNANNKLDLSLIGIPKESYGISNNARAALGMPDYEQAKFSVTNDETIRVTVKQHIRF